MDDFVLSNLKNSEDICKQHLEENHEVKENNQSVETKNFKFNCQRFLLECLKVPLVTGLREIILRKPSDPIEFLGQWLLHFKECERKAKYLAEFEAELILYRESLRILDNEDSVFSTCLGEDE